MAKDETAKPASLVFKALSDPTRRRVIEVLAASELPAGQIASLFPISGPSVSRHLGVLRSAGLVAERREANRIIYSFVPDQLAGTAGAWLNTVCPVLPPGQALPPARSSEVRKPAKKKAPSRAGGKRKRKTGGKKLAPPAALEPAGAVPAAAEATTGPAGG